MSIPWFKLFYKDILQTKCLGWQIVSSGKTKLLILHYVLILSHSWKEKEQIRKENPCLTTSSRTPYLALKNLVQGTIINPSILLRLFKIPKISPLRSLFNLNKP